MKKVDGFRPKYDQTRFWQNTIYPHTVLTVPGGPMEEHQKQTIGNVKPT